MTKLSEFVSQIIESYKLAFIFFSIALPLAMVPILAEALQHFAEFKLGMFSLREGEVFGDTKQAIRLLFGLIKVLAIFFIFLVLPRFFLHGRNQHIALSFLSGNIFGLIRGLIFVLLSMLWLFMVGPAVLPLFMPSLSEVKILLLSLGALLLPSIYLMKPTNNWIASLWGLPLPSDAQHKAMNKAIYGVGFIVQIAAIFPAMALHYWLGFNAMGATGITLAAILIFDSVVVGFLACLLASCIFVLIRDAYEPTTKHDLDTKSSRG